MIIVFTLTKINHLVVGPFYGLLASSINVDRRTASAISRLKILVKDICEKNNKD